MLSENSLIMRLTMMLVLTFAIGTSSLFAAEHNWNFANYFNDTLSVNESKSKTVYANEPYNWAGVKLIEGQTYLFTVGSPAWNNGEVETDAEGYPGEYPWLQQRRFPTYNWMALVGSLYTYQDKYSYTGKSFLIALGRTWKATKTGYLAAFANDCKDCYNNNSRIITLTIKRVE